MYRYFRPRIRSRHPSHKNLRPRNKTLPLFPFKSIIRFGSTTDLKDTVTNGGDRIELNIIQSIKNSANKLLMKSCFTNHNVKTADWWTHCTTELDSGFVKEDGYEDNTLLNIEELPFPIISKHIKGSRGTGNKKHDTAEQLESWMEGKNLDNYIFEKYYNYTREYRLHVTKNGCFYSCRKMLKSDTPNEAKWYRNDDHCVWIMESNDLFDKPCNWNELVKESIKALNSVGLDFGAIDLRIQSSTKSDNQTLRNNPKFIIVEINSAPSFGEVTEEKYIEMLPELLKQKYNENIH